MVPVGTMGSFWPGVSPFRAVGELMGCVGGQGLGACARLVFWGLSCLRGFFLAWVWPFQGCWGAYGLCPRSRARRPCAPRLPRFILLGSFSDTLLVVSILDIVYDWCL